MLSDMVRRIQEHADRLTDGQRLIADYLLRNYQTAAFLTAAALGRRVGVSESTVVRFATTLGYSGFPEMQQALQEMVKQQLTTVDRLLGTVEGMEGEDGLPYSVMRTDIANLTRTMQELPRAAFDAAVDAILAARTVWVIGLRSAWSVAFFFAYNLNWLLRNVRLVHLEGGAEPFEELVAVGPSDVVVGITFPRYTARTVHAFAFAKRKGARTIALTDGVMSPLARHADILLPARTNITSFADSFVAPLSVANALVTAVSVKGRERTEAALKEMEELWRQEGIYAIRE